MDAGLVSLIPSPIPTNSITFCTWILILHFHLLTGIHCWLILKFFINYFQIFIDIESVGETKNISLTHETSTQKRHAECE